MKKGNSTGRGVFFQARLALCVLGIELLCSSLVIAMSLEHSPDGLTNKGWSAMSANDNAQSLSTKVSFYSGEVNSGKTKLAAAVTANVDWVLVEEGQAVEKGELLIQLDDRDATLEVRLARASLHNSLAQLAALKQGAGPKIEYEFARSQIKTAIKEAELRLDQARLALSQTKVIAPFTGQISGLQVAPGDRVSAGHLLTGLIDSDTSETKVMVVNQ